MNKSSLVAWGGLVALVALAEGACEPEPAKTSDEITATATATATSAPATTSDPVATTAPVETSAPTQTAAPAVEDGPAIVYEGLKIRPLKPTAKLKVLEVKADGSVVGDGQNLGAFVKNELRDETGAPALRVAKDGSVEAIGQSSKKANFNEKDELLTPDGKVSVGKDGIPVFESKGRVEKAPMKVEGVTDKNRRAAVLLVTYVMLSAKPATASQDGPTSAPAKPAKPLATTQKPKSK